MAIEKIWGHFFKPEVRKQGESIFNDEAVSLSVAADSQIQAYVRSSGNSKVSFLSDSISSPTFVANCNCSSSAKGQFCKHIWATLLKVEKSFPDFLDSKTEIEKGSGAATADPRKTRIKSEEQVAREEQSKAKQASYRKEQYQKQKERAQELKGAKKKSKHSTEPAKPDYPEEVESALEFFNSNGFALGNPIDTEILKNAKRLLSRVFHPDKGGTHEEMLMLNENYDILMEFKNS